MTSGRSSVLARVEDVRALPSLTEKTLPAFGIGGSPRRRDYRRHKFNFLTGLFQPDERLVSLSMSHVPSR